MLDPLNADTSHRSVVRESIHCLYFLLSTTWAEKFSIWQWLLQMVVRYSLKMPFHYLGAAFCFFVCFFSFAVLLWSERKKIDKPN